MLFAMLVGRLRSSSFISLFRCVVIYWYFSSIVLCCRTHINATQPTRSVFLPWIKVPLSDGPLFCETYRNEVITDRVMLNFPTQQCCVWGGFCAPHIQKQGISREVCISTVTGRQFVARAGIFLCFPANHLLVEHIVWRMSHP